MQGSQRINGGAGLGNKDRKFVRHDNRIAIAILTGKINFHRYLGHAFQHELPNNARMPAGAARCNSNFGNAPYVIGRKREIGQSNIVRLLKAAINHGPHRLRLLIDLLQHEVRKSVLV